MKKIPLFMAFIFLLLACGKSDEQKFVKNLVPALEIAVSDRIQATERLYLESQSKEIEGTLPTETLHQIEQAHLIARRFYAFSNSFPTKPNADLRQSEYARLIERFNQSVDTMAAVIPGVKLFQIDFSALEHKTNALLTQLYLNYEMASNEISIVDSLRKAKESYRIRDDFNNAPYTNPLAATNNSHSFSIHMGYLLHASDRQIVLDTVLLNNKLIQIPIQISHEDELGIVYFKTLTKGHYVVKGKIHAVGYHEVHRLPFTHSFTIQ